RYQFTAHASGLLDRFGNPLDGNADGTGGDDLVRSFSVAIPQGQVLENRSNDNLASATPLPLTEDPASSGFLTSSVALGAIDPGNDNDSWSFSAQQNDRLIIDMESPASDIVPRFIVYNAAGQPLLDSNSWGFFGGPRKATNSVYTIPAAGTYYVRALD